MVNMRFPRRTDIDNATKGAKSDYGQQVSGMNAVLDKSGIDISERSKKSVIDNVKKVESGERSEVNAHQREAVGFARDSYESAKAGKYKQASVELAGAGLNTAGSLFKASYTQTPLEKKGVDPF